MSFDYGNYLLTDSGHQVFRDPNGTWAARVQAKNQETHAWLSIDASAVTKGTKIRPDKTASLEAQAWTKVGVVPPGGDVAYQFSCVKDPTEVLVEATESQKANAAYLLSEFITDLIPDASKARYTWMPELLKSGKVLHDLYTVVADLKGGDIPAVITDMYSALQDGQKEVLSALSKDSFVTIADLHTVSKLLKSGLVGWVLHARSVAGVLTEYVYNDLHGTTSDALSVVLTTRS